MVCLQLCLPAVNIPRIVCGVLGVLHLLHVGFLSPADEESVGWGPVLASLQVPELTMDDFLSESQTGGSFLTLYAFILQRLNTEYTAANEKRTLALINTWTSQVFPRFDSLFVMLACVLFSFHFG